MFEGTILAIDSAIRSGIAEGVPGGTPALSYVDFAHDSLDDHADIFARALRWMGRRCADNPPAMLVLEDLVLVHDKTVQSGLHAIFQAVARAKGIPITMVRVNTWRLHVLGQGNLKGPVAKARAVAVCQQLGWQVPLNGKKPPQPDHNAAEAAGQWLWACSTLAPKQAQRIPFFMRQGRAAA